MELGRKGREMTALVTGATGLVGSHTVDELLQRGHAVRALLRDDERAAALRERGVASLVGDVREPQTLKEAVRDVGVIYHCAAAVGAERSKREIYETNLTGAHNLLEAVRAAGKGRIVLLSSVNVLGTRDLDPATEDLPYRFSHDPAADVKIDAEKLALDYQRRHNVDVVIIRPGFIYGPRDDRNLPRLMSAIQRGKFRFIGSPNNVVPIVHVSDVVQALLLAGQTPSARGRVYNITDGSRSTIGERVGQLARLQGCATPERTLPFAVPYLAAAAFDWLQRLHLRRKPGPINRASLRFLGTSRFVDIRRAREELGYAPRVTLREGIAATVSASQEPHHDKALATS
jgi:nucleoside-diphosphate-sugar epimerase